MRRRAVPGKVAYGTIAVAAMLLLGVVEQRTAALAGYATDLREAAGSERPGPLPPPVIETTSVNSDGSVDVSGRAEDGSLVILFRGNEMESAQICVNGRFAFRKLPAAAIAQGLRLGTARLASVSLGGTPAVPDDLNPAPTAKLPASEIDAARQSAVAISAADFSRGDRTRARLVLSFDAGAENGGAAEILDVLAAERLHTTFFLTGTFIESYPDLVTRIVADGHEVGNHMFDHPHLTSFAANRRHETLPGLTREEFVGQLERTAAAFRARTGTDMAPYWRAPYGEHNGQLRAWAREAGYLHVGWTSDPRLGGSMDSLDWVDDPRARNFMATSKLVDRLLGFSGRDGRAAYGGIILMHLGSERIKDPIAPHLGRLIAGYRDLGYDFVSVSQLRQVSSEPPAVAPLAKVDPLAELDLQRAPRLTR